MSQFGTITINHKEYDLDDFELNDMAQVETLCPRMKLDDDGDPVQRKDGAVVEEPTPFGALDFAYTKTLQAFAFVILSKEDPTFSYEDAGRLKLIAFTSPDEKVPDTGPTAEPNQNGSDHDGSGVPDSATPLPGSALGTSDA